MSGNANKKSAKDLDDIKRRLRNSASSLNKVFDNPNIKKLKKPKPISSSAGPSGSQKPPVDPIEVVTNIRDDPRTRKKFSDEARVEEVINISDEQSPDKNNSIASIPEETSDDESFSDASEVIVMGDLNKLTDLVARLAQMQLDNQPQQQAAPVARPETLVDVMKRAGAGIIEFKKTNITNFLSSVEMHYEASPAEHRPQVVKIAQQKVVGCVLIETSVYNTFEAFKADLVANFKPAKSHTQLEVELATLTKKKEESIDQLAKRAMAIKVDYELAYKSELIALGADLDAVRLIEVERKAITSFRNAIPQA